MTETELQTESNTKDKKLYSSKAIGGATFLGGPLAAGYLIGENFKALDRPAEGRNALLLGIIATVLIFGGIFMIPENIIDKIPRQIIPIVYTAIIWGIVEWKQGEVLKRHKENNNSFFSGWRAAGIGFISLIIISIGIFGYAFLSTDNEVYDQYDAQMVKFSKNESESLVFYDLLETKTNFILLQELDNTFIPKWKENQQIIEHTNQWTNLPSELKKQNEILSKYCELRIKSFEAFKKALAEGAPDYSTELNLIHIEIEEELKKLN